MRYFLETLKLRNEPLFYFGLLCLLAALVCLALTRFTQTQVMGVNAWYKPFKFFLSATIFAWSMGWYMHYLGPLRDVNVYSWVVIGVLGFETTYIAIQAARGQLSHFNASSPFYTGMYSLMGAAIVIMTMWTAYIGWLFVRQDFPALPAAYVWGIRLGIFLFVIFAFQGGAMGSRMTHTIGGPDGGPGLPVVNWSTAYGDPRIAHFVGMHALQVLPILSYYLLKDVRATLFVGLLYGLLAALLFVQAMQGKPLVRTRETLVGQYRNS